MIKMKKILPIIIAATLLGGCGPGPGPGPEEKVTIENRVDQVLKSGENQVLRHDLLIGGLEVSLNTIYSLENVGGRAWQYTEKNTVGLGLEVLEPARYDVTLVSVYSDVSIVSDREKYNGLRQDSIWSDYVAAEGYGLPMMTNHVFKIMFSIEGLNQNESFLILYNGSGYGSSDRLKESRCSDYFEGSQIYTVWTILFRDIQTGDYYIETIYETIGAVK